VVLVRCSAEAGGMWEEVLVFLWSETVGIPALCLVSQLPAPCSESGEG
jgi:hypothetical protein